MPNASMVLSKEPAPLQQPNTQHTHKLYVQFFSLYIFFKYMIPPRFLLLEPCSFMNWCGCVGKCTWHHDTFMWAIILSLSNKVVYSHMITAEVFS